MDLGILGGAGLCATQGPCGKGFAGGIENTQICLPQMSQSWPWSCRGRQGSRQGASAGSSSMPAALPKSRLHRTARIGVSVPTSTNRALKTPLIFHSPLPPSLSAGRQIQLCSHSHTLIQVFLRSWGFIPGRIMCLLSPALTGTQLGPPEVENSLTAGITPVGLLSRCPGHSACLLALGKEKPP